jgi:hypothetical protein
VLQQLEKLDEAEIFARDAINFARDDLNDTSREIQAAGALAVVLLDASKTHETIEICDHYLTLYGTEDSEHTNMLRGTKSLALSQLGRHEEALAQLSFVWTTNCAIYADWNRLSQAQDKVGRRPTPRGYQKHGEGGGASADR